MNLIKQIFIFFLKTRRSLKWTLQTKKTESILPKNIISKELDVNSLGNILILVPHSDDEWIGCSCIIKKAKSITCLYFDYTRRIHHEENSDIRFRELSFTCKKYGIDLIVFGCGDVNIKNIINEKQINTIFTPSPYDWHEEHIKTFNFCTEHIKSNEIKIFCYHLSVPFIKNKCFYLPMSASQQKYKWDFFSKIYKSQKNIPVLRFMLQERLNGYLVDQYSCEMFYSYDDYPEVEVISLDERTILKQKLNNIYDVRKFILSK